MFECCFIGLTSLSGAEAQLSQTLQNKLMRILTSHRIDVELVGPKQASEPCSHVLFFIFGPREDLLCVELQPVKSEIHSETEISFLKEG